MNSVGLVNIYNNKLNAIVVKFQNSENIEEELEKTIEEIKFRLCVGEKEDFKALVGRVKISITTAEMPEESLPYKLSDPIHKKKIEALKIIYEKLSDVEP